MRALDDNRQILEDLKEKEKTMPAGDIAANIRKRISDIRDLLLKAEAALDRKRDPERHFQTIDLILQDLKFEG